MDLRRGLLIITALLIVVATSLSVLTYNQSSEIATLTEKKSELETDKLKLETDKADLIGRISELEEGMVETRALVATLEKQLADLKSDNQQLQDDIRNREEMISVLEKELADARTEISDLNDQIEEYLKQIKALSMPVDQRHLNASLLALQDCSQCHGPVADQAVKGESNEYHNIHLNNLLLNFECTDCHKSVDILSRSENLTRVADIETCKGCHTPFPDKVWMGTKSSPEQFASRFSFCTGCHQDWREEMADVSYVNLDIITEEDCTTCHLKNALFPTEKKSVTIPCAKCH